MSDLERVIVRPLNEETDGCLDLVEYNCVCGSTSSNSASVLVEKMNDWMKGSLLGKKNRILREDL
jgi:hypothetical protein